MEYLDQVYIRLSDGLIMFPTQGKESQLFNYYNSEEPPITIYDLQPLGFVELKNLINKPIETANEQPILLCSNCNQFQECPNYGISEPLSTRDNYNNENWNRETDCPGPGAEPPCPHEHQCFCGMA